MKVNLKGLVDGGGRLVTGDDFSGFLASETTWMAVTFPAMGNSGRDHIL